MYYVLIKKKVKKLAGFSLNRLKPIEWVDRCHVPVKFITGKQDDFVDSSHVKRLFDKYMGSKKYIRVRGDHNTERPQKITRYCCKFIKKLFLN